MVGRSVGVIASGLIYASDRVPGILMSQSSFRGMDGCLSFAPVAAAAVLRMKSN